MAILTASPRSAALWSPRQREWLVRLDAINAILCFVAFTMSLINGMQVVDNYSGRPADSAGPYLGQDPSYYDAYILAVALVVPLVAGLVALVQMTLYGAYVLHPVVVVTTACVLLGGWATAGTFGAFSGMNNEAYSYEVVNNPDAPYDQRTYTEVSLLRDVPINGGVWLVRVLFCGLSGVAQILYIAISARAIKAWRRERRGAAKVTFYDVPEGQDNRAPHDYELESQAPAYTAPASTPPRSFLGSITSTAVATDAGTSNLDAKIRADSGKLKELS